MTRLSILNPELSTLGGHHFHYARGIYGAAQRAGVDFSVYCNRQAEPVVLEGLPAHPIFESLSPGIAGGMRIPGLGRVLMPLKGHKAFREMNRLLTPSTGQVVFIENFRSFYWPCLTKWINNLDAENAPALIFMLRYGCWLPTKSRWGNYRCEYEKLFRVLEHQAERINIRLVTDSDLLADQYRQLTSLPVEVIPTMPHLPADIQRSTRAPGTPLRIASPGIASHVKGIDLLGDAICRLAEQGALDRVHFTVQCYKGRGNEHLVDRLVMQLAPWEGRGVELIRDAVDEEGYWKILTSADMIATPYRVDRYQGTSGPFAEALSLGMPVIATRGTWMAHELGKYDAGLVFAEDNADSLAETILRAAGEYETLQANAKEAGARWREFHNPDSCLKQLLRVVEE